VLEVVRWWVVVGFFEIRGKIQKNNFFFPKDNIKNVKKNAM
jgi:hypothetical protein